jgi:hypothetical protein
LKIGLKFCIQDFGIHKKLKTFEFPIRLDGKLIFFLTKQQQLKDVPNLQIKKRGNQESS